MGTATEAVCRVQCEGQRSRSALRHFPGLLLQTALVLSFRRQSPFFSSPDLLLQTAPFLHFHLQAESFQSFILGQLTSVYSSHPTSGPSMTVADR